MGVFGSNPKGTGGLGRHSLLLSSPRPLVLASSAAAIGAPSHPFAFASIALTGPSSRSRLQSDPRAGKASATADFPCREAHVIRPDGRSTPAASGVEQG